MYKVSLLRDPALQEQLCERCGIPYTPGFPALSIETEKGYVGVIPFYIEGGNGYLQAIGALPGAVEEDFEPFFVAGRQALNLIDQCGAHDGYLLSFPPEQQRLVTAIGFKERDGQWHMDLRGFFIEPCKHPVEEE